MARNMESAPFPPYTDRRDRLYDTVCRVSADRTRATCVGHRRFGPRPGERVTATGLLRLNGSWSLLCWPNPSQLCSKIQIREQRANPITE